MKKLFFCAEEKILGRFFSYISTLIKKNKIEIYGIGKLKILGKKENIIKKYKSKFFLGRKGKRKGPFFSKNSIFLLKKIFKGMINYKKNKKIISRIKFYLEKFPKNKKKTNLETKITNKFIYFKDLINKL